MSLTTTTTQQQQQQSESNFILSPFDFDVSDHLFDNQATTTAKKSLFLNSPIISPFAITPTSALVSHQQDQQQQQLHSAKLFDSYFTELLNNNNNNNNYDNNNNHHLYDQGASVNTIMAPGEDLTSSIHLFEHDNFLSPNVGWHHLVHPPPYEHQQFEEQYCYQQLQIVAEDNNNKNTKPPKLQLPKVDLDGKRAKKITTTLASAPVATTSAATTTAATSTTKKTITTTSTATNRRRKTASVDDVIESSSTNYDSSSSTSSCAAKKGTRAWKTIFVDEKFGKDISIELSSKTRCEDPCAEVPSKMYSSLKYEIRQHATGALCDEVAFLLARITVVDSVNFEEIKKDNKPVLKGVVESALTKPPGDNSTQRLYGVLKCQFTDVSYHHKKRDFCWQIALFRPDDLENPIMIKRSAPYKVFARKPATNKKRKRDDSALDQFQDRLDDLFKDAKKLKMDDKKKIVELLCEKMLSLDGKFFAQKASELQNQSLVDEAQD